MVGEMLNRNGESWILENSEIEKKEGGKEKGIISLLEKPINL